MAKIGYSISFTVNMGDYNSGKFEMRVDDIDTDQDVTEQLRKSHEALWQTVQWATDQAAVELEKTYRKKITDVSSA